MSASQTIQVDPELFASIDAYYEKQRGDLLQVKAYVATNCSLSDSFGILLSALKPQYEEARDKAFTAMQTVADTLDNLAKQVEGYADDVEQNDNDLQTQINTLTAQLTAMQSAQSTGGSGGGSGYGGGGGGGSYTGGSGSVSPTGNTTEGSGGNTSGDDGGNSADGDGNVQVITGDDGNVTVIIGDNNVVDAPDPGDASTETPPDADPASSATPTPPTDPASGPTPAPPVDPVLVADPVSTASAAPDPVPAPTATGPVPSPVVSPVNVPPLDPAVIAEENARHAELYDQLWQEQAANDPLGRSAEELRLAWEARESIELDPTVVEGVSAVGYGELPGLAPISMRFELFLPDLAHSATPTGVRV